LNAQTVIWLGIEPSLDGELLPSSVFGFNT